MTISPPHQKDYPEFYHTYVSKVDETDLLPALQAEMDRLESLVGHLDDRTFKHAYAADKWNIKEVLIHMIDTERVFAYRAMRFARRDQTPLPGFEQEDYGKVVKGTDRSGPEILQEFKALRQASVLMYKGFTEDDLNATGTASNGQFTVRAKGYIILGHARHHRMILESKYLNQ